MAGFIRLLVAKCNFHLYSMWLFTSTDLKTILGPSVLFAILNSTAISLNPESFQSTCNVPTPSQILSRAPLVIFWVWINLLPFAIDNQRQPDAIKEDTLNKSWRPLPSQRLAPEPAKRLMVLLYCIAIVTSHLLENLPQCLALIILGCWYNDFNGGDVSCMLRNFINACGYMCFSSGALEVAVGEFGTRSCQPVSMLQLWRWWYAVLACVIFSTVQMQDMYDQRGDGARNRKTVPLVVGDSLSRWMIAIPTIFWSWMTPFLWEISPLGYAFPVSLGTIVAVRALRVRTEAGDKRTFQAWNLWIGGLYSLPLIKALGV